jgi:hypothetical protein
MSTDATNWNGHPFNNEMVEAHSDGHHGLGRRLRRQTNLGL